jgi:hypothetical protein
VWLGAGRILILKQNSVYVLSSVTLWFNLFQFSFFLTNITIAVAVMRILPIIARQKASVVNGLVWLSIDAELSLFDGKYPDHFHWS